jgi:hypothetical protein
MNEPHQLTNETASLEIYQRCVWALTTAGLVMFFFFSAWFSIQRVKVFHAQYRQREAEFQADTARGERDDARRQLGDTTRALNERLAKAEAARLAAEKEAHDLAAEKEAHDLAASAFNAAVPSRPAEAPSKPASAPKGSSSPTVQELTLFIKTHLTHMTEPVEAQLPDYADEVDFHDKPHASQIMIRNDREQWLQKYPFRLILKDEIQPQISAVRDTRFGWIATATFDWRWVYKSRSGALARGVTRDTWKIIPSPEGFKIISEHSADPATGVAKD